MQLEFYKSTWGMPGTFDEQLARIAGAGYAGWEEGVRDPAEVRAMRERHGLKWVAMAFTEDPDVLASAIDQAHQGGAESMTVHAGAATMSFEEGLDCLGRMTEITAQAPFPVNFETHRGRLLYEPLSTARYLDALPNLWLCADFSHWTVVTESLLDGFGPQMELAMVRTRHLHARVGHEEGPQVGDPRRPIWEPYVARHEQWWDQIRAAAQTRGQAVLTIDPEFGPSHYQPADLDGQPLADIWEIAGWIRDRLSARWNS